MDKAKITTKSDHIIASYKAIPHEALQDLFDAYVGESSFHADPYINAYNSGKRDLVMSIIALAVEDKNKLFEKIKTLKGES